MIELVGDIEDEKALKWGVILEMVQPVLKLVQAIENDALSPPELWGGRMNKLGISLKNNKNAALRAWE